MNINFYRTESDEKCVTKVLTDINTLTGSMRDDCDILQPIILVGSNVTTYNYCYIPDFQRYYWITSCNQYRKNLWIIRLKVDVLMSYGAGIRQLEGIVDRYDSGSKYAQKDLVRDVRKHLKEYKWDYTFQEGRRVLVTRRGG